MISMIEKLCCHHQDAGYTVTLGSIGGGKVPLEPNSLQGDAVTPVTQKFLDDGKTYLRFEAPTI